MRLFGFLLGTILLAAPSRAAETPAGRLCSGAEARLEALRGALRACRASALGSCGLSSVLGPDLLPTDELARVVDELERAVGASCPAPRPGRGDPAVPGDASPARPRRLGRGPTLGRLLEMAGAVEAAADPSAPLDAAWGELRPASLSLGSGLSPSLTPSLPLPDLKPSLPDIPKVEVQPARPMELAAPRAAPAAQDPGSTPCADLRDKARRLRSAADQCDSDVAAGAPYCDVVVTFRSPSIPKSLSPSSARAYASDFESVAAGMDERACAAYGGEGSIPAAPAAPPSPPAVEPEPAPSVPAPPAPSQPGLPTEPPVPSAAERIEDVFDTTANRQVQGALLEFAIGGLLSKISYGPDAPWTQALRKHRHLIGVRERIRAEYRKGSGLGRSRGSDPYNLNEQSWFENLRFLLRDIAAPVLGLNMAYTTGSIGFEWKQNGPVDTANRTVVVEFTAKDSLRLGSLTRLPRTQIELLPDSLSTRAAPGHRVQLEWRWTEVIYY